MFRCSAAELRDFASGRVWSDIMQELATWRQNILAELSAPTFSPAQGKMIFSKDERVLYDEYLRGSLLALERVEQLPVMMAGMIETANEEQPLEHKEESDDE